MVIEQGHQKRSARFRLAGDKAGALLEGQRRSHWGELTICTGEMIIAQRLKAGQNASEDASPIRDGRTVLSSRLGLFTILILDPSAKALGYCLVDCGETSR